MSNALVVVCGTITPKRTSDALEDGAGSTLAIDGRKRDGFLGAEASVEKLRCQGPPVPRPRPGALEPGRGGDYRGEPATSGNCLSTGDVIHIRGEARAVHVIRKRAVAAGLVAPP